MFGLFKKRPKPRNVVDVQNLPPPIRTVKDMRPGEEGYVVPWVYLHDEYHIEETAEVHDSPHGTASVRICCISKGVYSLVF